MVPATTRGAETVGTPCASRIAGSSSDEIAETNMLVQEIKKIVNGHRANPVLNALATVLVHVLVEIPNGVEAADVCAEDIRQGVLKERNARLNA